MKNVSLICLISILLGAGSLPTRKACRMFPADWCRESAASINTIDGGKVTGTFTGRNGGEDTGATNLQIQRTRGEHFERRF